MGGAGSRGAGGDAPCGAGGRAEPLLGIADLEGWMRARGIAGQVVRLKEPTPTVAAAARVLGVGPEGIVKSLVFVAGGRPLLVVARGLARVDPAKVARAVGAGSARLAEPQEVEAVTGYPVGATPPFGHLSPLPTLIDAGVAGGGAEVYAGGGAEDALLRIDPGELLRATGGRVADLVERR
ncbi:MAG: YbaK/EbsC family protein [Acetobacteraceae bacterium]|nr:YbaK/EbsC family protein [Acetobacteraceae bacterium]